MLSKENKRGAVMRSINLLIILLVLAFGVQAADGQLQMEQMVLETVDGLEIHAHRIANGNDAALICCHRLLSSKNSFDLNGFGNVLLRECDVITFDFRGHGKSEGYSTCGGDEVLDLLPIIIAGYMLYYCAGCYPEVSGGTVQDIMEFHRLIG